MQATPGRCGRCRDGGIRNGANLQGVICYASFQHQASIILPGRSSGALSHTLEYLWCCLQGAKSLPLLPVPLSRGPAAASSLVLLSSRKLHFAAVQRAQLDWEQRRRADEEGGCCAVRGSEITSKCIAFIDEKPQFQRALYFCNFHAQRASLLGNCLSLQVRGSILSCAVPLSPLL